MMRVRSLSGVLLSVMGLSVLWGVFALPLAPVARADEYPPTAVINETDVLSTPPPFGGTTDTPTPTSEQTATDAPTRTPQRTATATPDVAERPDTCEPNNDREHPCVIGVDQVNGPYTFLPVPDQDWYTADVGDTRGLATEVTVRSSGNADLITSLSRADGSPLGVISSPAMSMTLAADVGGVVVLHVENRSPDDPEGASYTVEVRRVLPPPPAIPPEVARLRQMKPDALENNWDAATAAPAGVGYVYTLNFVCPDLRPDACSGGDHDYLRLAVKANATYVLGAFDLGPGVDTVLDLFWGSEEIPVATSDDAGPIGFASLLRWTAPSDGEAILRVGPRTGGLKPLVFDEQASTFHLAVALDGSDLARQITEQVQQQTQRPTPTPRPAPPVTTGGAGGTAPRAPAPALQAPAPAPQAPISAPAPQALAQPPTVSDVRGGQAVVIVGETIVRAAPNVGGEGLQTLPGDTIVTLTGQGQGVWVRVETSEGVLPGWVDSRDLRRLPEGAPSFASAPSTTALTATTITATTSATTTAPSSPTTQQARVQRLDDAPPPPTPTPPTRATLTVHVSVRAAPLETASATSKNTARRSLALVRVQLVNAFGDILSEGLTNANGQISFTRDLDVGTAVRVHVPSAGLEVPVDWEQPSLELALPVPPTPATGATP